MERPNFERTSSAGSFVIGPRHVQSLRGEHGHVLVSLVHLGAPCGGGHALDAHEVHQTAQAVADFVEKDLGARYSAAKQVRKQLESMALDSDPLQHALWLARYNETNLRIPKQLVAVHDLLSGNIRLVKKTGNWSTKDLKSAVVASCADARHLVKSIDAKHLAELAEKGVTRIEGREQGPQNPEKPVFSSSSMDVYNKKHGKHFTIVGMSKSEFKKLLTEASDGAELPPHEIHSLAAAALSAFYYHHNHWRGDNQLIKDLKIT